MVQHSRDQNKYVASKQIKLWEANINVFYTSFFPPHLFLKTVFIHGVSGL